MAKAKKVSIVLVNKVLLKSGYHFPDEIIECDKSEAKRLIKLNAALPCAEVSPDEIYKNKEKK